MPVPPTDRAAKARATFRDDPLRSQKISDGLQRGARRRKAHARAVQVLRDAVPDLDLLLGDELEAVVIVIQRREGGAS